MNTLWASLLALIVIAIAVVMVFNLLQGRQNRQRDAWRDTLAAGGSAPTSGAGADATDVSAAVEAGVPDGSGRIEPTLTVAAPAPLATADRPLPPAATTKPPPAHAEINAAREPVVPTRVEPSLQPASIRELARDDAIGAVLDPRLDCIVALALPVPIAPERLLAAISTMRRAGAKPIVVEADTGDGRWSLPFAASGALRRVRAGVLLANRNGPLNAMEFSDFAAAVVALGQAIGAGGAIVPEMAPVLEHARRLDDACAQLDGGIGLNVETPTALSPGELAALATGLGLHERGNNRFAALGSEGEVLFSLALGERAEQLTLLLDAPRAPEYADPWERMVEAARLCAERTGGRVVDDAGRPFTDAAVGAIARQLAVRYEALREAGLDAGSPLALRVFN